MQQSPEINSFISENKQVISTFLKHLCFRPDIVGKSLIENGINEFRNFNTISHEVFSYIYDTSLIEDNYYLEEYVEDMSFEESVNTAIQFKIPAHLLRPDVIKYMIENNLDEDRNFYNVTTSIKKEKDTIIQGIESSSKANEPRYIKIVEEISNAK